MVRYSRPARWFHTAVYVGVFVLLGTGWWLLLGREGERSPLTELLWSDDEHIHEYTGFVLAALAALAVLIASRGTRAFLAESLRFRRGDGRWLAKWPSAAFTGRFLYSEGHFDPGQRIANLAFTAGLLVMVGSGIGMVLLPGRDAYAFLETVHRWTTYALTPVIVGHVLVGSGLLPGYRGVWRSIHWGGELDTGVARRLWPGWTENVMARSRREDDAVD
ncbi:MAG: cytochrome b/b6 domain-containing protein [Actinomycetota bacterium]